MWKLLVGFVVFAAVALYVLKQFGGDIAMGGESHDVTGGSHATPAASAADMPASAASN